MLPTCQNHRFGSVDVDTEQLGRRSTDALIRAVYERNRTGREAFERRLLRERMCEYPEIPVCEAHATAVSYQSRDGIAALEESPTEVRSDESRRPGQHNRTHGPDRCCRGHGVRMPRRSRLDNIAGPNRASREQAARLGPAWTRGSRMRPTSWPST